MMATSIKLDEQLKIRLQNLARLRQRTPHWIMREAVRQYVEREEARESFKQEALSSWSAYRQDGLHLTGTEVDNWLNVWGTPEESAAPACHE